MCSLINNNNNNNYYYYNYRLPGFTTPTVSYMIPLIQDAAVISIVTFSVSISLAQVFAKQYNYTVSANQVSIHSRKSIPVIYVLYMYNNYRSSLLMEL